jgi:hypothetical protein
MRTFHVVHLKPSCMHSNARNSALDLEPKGIVSYGFPTNTDQVVSVKYLEERYLSSPSSNVANGTIDQDSVPSETVDFDALSLMPLGDAKLLPEPEETILLYVATSIRRKYGMPSFSLVLPL